MSGLQHVILRGHNSTHNRQNAAGTWSHYLQDNPIKDIGGQAEQATPQGGH